MTAALTTLEQHAASELARLAPPGVACLLAVSGGPDSLSLLEILHRSREVHQHRLIVAHVDHGLHPESGAVAAAVAGAAEARAIECHVVRLNLPAGVSETIARRSRRAALRRIAATADAGAIVLAHHADDQAETVLLRVLRGSGPAGLAGMTARRGPWLRPLLRVRRAELADYLTSRRLVAWADPANSDPRHLRSWVRTRIVPALQQRLPDLVERLTGLGAQAAAARAAWSEVLDALPQLDVRAELRGISVAAPVLQGYRSALRHAILAAVGRQIGVLIGSRHLAALDRLLAAGAQGGAIDLTGRFRAELAFGRLALYQSEDAVPDPRRLAPGEDATFGAARFHTRVGKADSPTRDGWQAALHPGAYFVRRWQPGDRIRPLGGTGTRPVAVLLREARIPPARRTSWPVVVKADDATIVWVPGICRADAGVPAKGTEAWRVECAFA
ncbi:MAG: tRNA lysidine(34) synthetase TilS [Gemmatimonadales bacterium]